MGFSRFEQNWLLVQRILASFGDGMLGLIQILTRFNNLFIDGHLQIIFWDKAYYRIFSRDMQQYGYQLQAKKPANNILRFQRMGISVVIDITVWADMYVLDLFQL